MQTRKFFTLVAALILSACSLGESDRTLVDQGMWLKDGQAVSWPLDAGRYKLEMTASADGASVEWIGAACPGTGETTQYSSICDLPQTGQIIVKNPTVLGLGASVSTTIKIVRLVR